MDDSWTSPGSRASPGKLVRTALCAAKQLWQRPPSQAPGNSSKSRRAGDSTEATTAANRRHTKPKLPIFATARKIQKVRLALHRSITFWSGILVMSFLCWAWWSSYRSAPGIMKGQMMVSSRLGGLHLETKSYSRPLHVLHNENLLRFRDPLPSPFFDRGKNEDRDVMRSWKEEFDQADDLRTYLGVELRYLPADHWLLFVPYWLIMLTMAMPWTALLLWRAKRRKRASDRKPQNPASLPLS